MKYQLEITSNGGYAADQVKSITAGELISILSDLDENDEIVLHDQGNRYGASYGYTYGNLIEADNDEDIDDIEEYVGGSK